MRWSTTVNDEKYLYPINRNRFIQQHSRSIFDKAFKDIFTKENQYFIVIGADSGLLIRYAHALKTDNTFLFVESVENIEIIRDEVADLLKDEQLHLITMDQIESFFDERNFVKRLLTQDTTLLKSLACQDDFQDVYGDMFDWVNQVYIKKQMTVLTSTIGMQRFYKQQILNSPDFLRPATLLQPLLYQRDVLILGAGPSLDSHVEWVKNNRDKFVVIAVSRLGEFLKKNSIVPDFMITVDPDPRTMDVYHKAFEISDKVDLIASSKSYVGVINNWQSNIYMLDDRLGWESQLSEKNWASGFPTVSHTALRIALFAEANRVFLVGVDMCYNEQLQTHVKNTTEGAIGGRLDMLTYAVDTYSGRVAETNAWLLIGIDAFVELAKRAAQSNIQVFNLSIEAAAIEGIHYIDKHTITNLNSIANHLQSEKKQLRQDEGQVLEYLLQLKEEISSFVSDIQTIKKLSIKNYSNVDKLFRANGNPNSKIKSQFDKVERYLQQLEPSRYRFIMWFGLGDFLENTKINAKEEPSRDEIKIYFKAYFSKINDVLEKIQDTLDETLRKIDMRCYEIRGENLDELTQYWIETKQPLRLHKLTPEQFSRYSESEVNSALSRLTDSYDALKIEMAENENMRASSFKTTENIIKAARNFYLRKAKDSIIALNSITPETENGIDFSSIKLLLNGFCSELEGDIDLALSHYEAIIAADKIDFTVGLNALKRVLDISIKQHNHSMALKAMDCISALDPGYLKVYAEFLLKIGHTHEALDRLADHHQHFPEDIDSLLRIAEVYSEIGNDDQAKELVMLINSQYPEYKGIEALKNSLNLS